MHDNNNIFFCNVLYDISSLTQATIGTSTSSDDIDLLNSLCTHTKIPYEVIKLDHFLLPSWFLFVFDHLQIVRPSYSFNIPFFSLAFYILYVRVVWDSLVLSIFILISFIFLTEDIISERVMLSKYLMLNFWIWYHRLRYKWLKSISN